jgi:hypothetical protein
VNANEPENTVWLSPLVTDSGFSVQFRGDHVHVQMGKGLKVGPGQSSEFWDLIRNECERHGSHRVLVEGYLPAGERDTAEVVAAGQRTAVVPKLWLAFCFADFKPTEQSELYETIAASQGVRVKFFSDPERALNWLRRNSPQ